MTKPALEAFLAHCVSEGVPLMALVAHGSHSLAWLADHADDKFRLSYGANGTASIIETVSAAGILTRCHELGWTPMPADYEGQAVCFEDAVRYVYRGVHWFATECDEDTGMPLALPARTLDAGRRRAAAVLAKRLRIIDRARRAKERAQAAERKRRDRVRQRELTASLADHAQALAAQAGRPINRSTAERKGRRQYRALMAEIVARMSDLSKAHGERP